VEVGMEGRSRYLELRSSSVSTFREEIMRAGPGLTREADIQKRGHMPITAFNSFTDGLDPNRRSREHFITNINLEDDRLWVPYADGVWFQPCCFNVTS